MKFVARYAQDPARIEFLRARLETDWTIEVMEDSRDLDALGAAIADADMLLSMSWEPHYPEAPQLKLLHLPGAGLDQIDFDSVPDGAAVCNVYEHEIGIAEFLVLALLEWEIRLFRMHGELREGRWRGSFVDDAPLHGELFGKCVGYIGYGRIARESAARLASFGVRQIACSRTPRPGDGLVESVQPMDALPALLEACDYAIVCCPLDDSTRGLIDARALEALGPGGVIVNVGRGPVIDEDALWQALSSRSIAGAIIDTWYQYPDTGSETCFPSRHPIHTLDNVILSPHASGWSAGLSDRRWGVIAQNMNRLARGEPLLNVVAPARATS